MPILMTTKQGQGDMLPGGATLHVVQKAADSKYAKSLLGRKPALGIVGEAVKDLVGSGVQSQHAVVPASEQQRGP